MKGKKDIVKKLLRMVPLVFLLLASTAQADITVMSFSGSDEVCNHVAGLWKGEGDVSLYGFPCHYNGTANITALSDPKIYNLDVNLTGGNHFWCPNESVSFPGSCEAGNIKIHTDYADLNGTLNSAGTSAQLHGVVYVSKIPVKVNNIRFDKQ